MPTTYSPGRSCKRPIEWVLPDMVDPRTGGLEQFLRAVNRRCIENDKAELDDLVKVFL